MATLVTIFGGSGFLGRHTVRAFAQAGWRVRVACRHPNSANYLLPMGTVGQIQVVKTDVTDPDQIAAALKGANAAVNLVGVLYQSGRNRFGAIHADAAGAIARAAKAEGAAALVQVSALGANAESDSTYARSKAEGETRVREAFPDAAILRPSIVFGPEDAFFNKFAWLARMLPFLPLIGGGHTQFQPVFVGDVADAIVKCATDKSTRGKTYELGGPSIYSFKELMQFILRVTGRAGKRLLLPAPFWLATLKSYFLVLLPNPLLTPDQVRLLKHDSVVSDGALTFADLGLQPDSVEAVVPGYLWRYRPKGQYEDFVAEKISAVPETQ